ncbi:hypothetical protein AB6A40_007588 [Gnathostoma spinigerum]|uniref:Tyrosinase copper-binding domain-containing protein n=1 Tax=Gnathostoma spinigerum TaxID=75299 RepID=A0ABD6ELN3_9BILA
MYFLSLLSPILVLLIANALSQETENCDNAPTPAMKEYCLKLRAMAAHSRATFQKENDAGTWKPANIPAFLRPIAVQPGSRGQVASNPLDCMTLTCLCPYVKGKISGTQCILPSGQPMKMAYRKEYRMLSEEERNRFHRAITILKRSGEYDRLGRIHRAVGSGSGAHSGPGFLPWHREFMKRFEVALRLIDPEVSVPYWDSVVDHYLPDPRDSILFSDIFAGNTDIRGNVVTGPYAFWVAMNGYPTIIR